MQRMSLFDIPVRVTILGFGGLEHIRLLALLQGSDRSCIGHDLFSEFFDG